MSEAKKDTKWIKGELKMESGNQSMYHIEVPANTGKSDIQLLIEYAYKLYHPETES